MNCFGGCWLGAVAVVFANYFDLQFPHRVVQRCPHRPQKGVLLPHRLRAASPRRSRTVRHSPAAPCHAFDSALRAGHAEHHSSENCPRHCRPLNSRECAAASSHCGTLLAQAKCLLWRPRTLSAARDSPGHRSRRVSHCLPRSLLPRFPRPCPRGRSAPTRAFRASRPSPYSSQAHP